jgi:hypothetical protein
MLDWTRATNNSNHAKCKISYTGLDKDPLHGMCHVTCYRRTDHAEQDLCSPRTVTWTLKIESLWNAIPAHTSSYLRRRTSLTRWLTSRFYAVIPQLPRYLGNYRPLVADNCTWLMVIICCYYFLEATKWIFAWGYRVRHGIKIMTSK